MFVQPIFVVTILYSIVAVMGAKPEDTTATPVPGDTSEGQLAPMKFCQNLTKFNETVKMSAKDLKNSLETCGATEERMNVTGEGEILLKLYDNLKNNTHLEKLGTLFNSKEIVNKISECVSKRGKKFTSDDARKHLGFSDTLSLKFETRNCLDKMELYQCVEGVYFDKVENASIKNHKNAFMSSFEMLSEDCALIRDSERNTGEHFSPSTSFTLIAVTSLILFKLIICNAS